MNITHRPAVLGSDSAILVRQQFVISPDRCEVPEGMHEASFGGLHIHIDKRWETVRILDKTGVQVGLFFGLVVDPANKKVAHHDITWNVQSRNGLKPEAFEEFIYGFTGIWCCIAKTKNHAALYLDPGGCIPAVFCSERRIAASTAIMIYSDEELAEKSRGFPRSYLELDKHFPAGLTAHLGIERLIINFRLNLDSWKQERFWSPEPKAPDTKKTLDGIIARARATIEAMQTDASTAVPLTAGHETRALLAFCRPFLARTEFYTVNFRKNIVDMATAKRLVNAHKLHHQWVKPKMRNAAERELWFKRTAYGVGGDLSRFDIVLPNLPRYLLTGLYGEVGRGFLYAAADKATDKLEAPELLRRLNLPITPEFLAAVNWWLTTVPNRDFFTTIDMAYLELRMGGWGAVKIYGRDSEALPVAPLCDRAIISSFFDLPHDIRANHELCPELARRVWPELMQIPINTGTRIENMHEAAYKIINPARLGNKLRKEWRRVKRAVAG